MAAPTKNLNISQHFFTFWMRNSARNFLLTSFGIHLAQIPICLVLGSFPLALINVLSCVVYVFLLSVAKNRPDLAITGGEVEVVFFSLIASTITGWDSGYFLYLICLLAVSSYLESVDTRCSVTAVQALDLECMLVLLCISKSIPLNIQNAPPLRGTALWVLFVLNLSVCLTVTLLSVHLSSYSLRLRNRELESANQHLEYIASHDPLTGLQNRRNVYETLETLCKNAESQGVFFSVAMGDIDNFKRINDQYGHNYGDLVLVSIADCIRSCIRSTDVVCRWGGEEVLLLFIDTPIADAEAVLNRIRNALHDLTSGGRPPFFREVTLTFGLTEYTSPQSVKEVLAEADRLLYAGKQSGKNCIMTRETSPLPSEALPPG